MSDKLITFGEVSVICRALGLRLTEAKLRRWGAKGKAPRSFKIGQEPARWSEAAVRLWVSDLLAEVQTQPAAPR